MRRFRYEISFNDDPAVVSVEASFDEKMTKTVSEYPSEMFYRASLSDEFIMQRGDFLLISNADFETKFLFNMYVINDDDTEYLYFTGSFFKTDCNFNDDDESVEFKPEVVDAYVKILIGIEKEFDLVNDVAPPASLINYIRPPMVQLANLARDSFAAITRPVTNYVQGSHFESYISIAKRDPINEPNPLLDKYNFGKIKDVIYIADSPSGLNPDVSGTWQLNSVGGGNFQYGSANGQFSLRVIPQNDPDNNFVREIFRVSDGVTLYRTDPSNLINFIPVYQSADRVNIPFVSLTDSTSKCILYHTEIWGRLLTDEESIQGGGLTTNEFHEDDDSDKFSYSRCLPLADIDNMVFAFDEISTTSEGFGKFHENSLNAADEFVSQRFLPPLGAIPLLRSVWIDFSMWVTFSPSEIQTYINTSSSPRVLENGYSLGACVKGFLALIDEDLIFEETEAHSKFFYAVVNPISGENNVKYFVTPKSNILIGNQIQASAASKAPTKLSEFNDLLWKSWKCKWDIYDGNKFRIEHRKFYDNGLSYTVPNIGVDLTNLIEPKTEKNWGINSNEYNYSKQELPDRIEYGWMDAVGEAFKGFHIEIISPYVNTGNVETWSVQRFSSDIGIAQAQSETLSKDGFFVLAAEEIDGEFHVPIITFNIAGTLKTYTIQNGHLAFVYLQDRFHRYGLPALNVNINTLVTTALSEIRAKNQELGIASNQVIDPMQLATTQIGNGKIKTIVENISDGGKKISLKHDTRS